MVVTRPGRLRGALVALLTIVAALWYLRDPAWLATETTGLRGWRQAPDGTRYRWSGGHASFFVPSNASSARFRISTTFDESDRRPMLVDVSLDDQPVARVLLTDASWHPIEIALPPHPSRRFRRVDVRTNIVRDDNHGVRISEVANRFQGTSRQSRTGE